LISEQFPKKTLTDLATDRTGGSFWYLASIYSQHPRGFDAAYQEALDYAAILLRAGIYAFSPIVHSHPVASERAGLDGGSHNLWMPLDIAILKGSHGLLIAPQDGWRLSKGIEMEINAAKVNDIPIFLLELQ